MKKTFVNITLASIVTIAAYLVLYAIWGAILSGVENVKVRLFIIALMTSVAYSFFLLYFSKIRKGVGEDEMLRDYKEKSYTGFKDDMKIVLQNEKRCLILIASIIFACFALNTFDSLVFEKKVISFPTFIYIPMNIFGTFFDIIGVGYVVSGIIIAISYILMLLIYRKKKYNYWQK